MPLPPIQEVSPWPLLVCGLIRSGAEKKVFNPRIPGGSNPAGDSGLRKAVAVAVPDIGNQPTADTGRQWERQVRGWKVIRGSEAMSRLRQRLREELQKLHGLAEASLGSSGLLAGSLYERRRRCGRERCRCSRGPLHRSAALAVGSNGNRRLISLVGVDLDKVMELNLRWRHLRQARADMVRTFGELIVAFDELCRLRQVKSEKLPKAAAVVE